MRGAEKMLVLPSLTFRITRWLTRLRPVSSALPDPASDVTSNVGALPCRTTFSARPDAHPSIPRPTDFHDAAMIAYMLLTLPWMVGATMTTPAPGFKKTITEGKQGVENAGDNAGVRRWR